MNLQVILEQSLLNHNRLCPRQILGARLGLYGLKILNVGANQNNKRLLVIVETDGCFVSGITAATGCAVGHRTLRVEDYGKTAATFIDTQTNRAVRITPVLDLRERAGQHVPEESRRYFAQMQAYQTLPDDEMFAAQEVCLDIPTDEIVSRPGSRVCCASCGEEIMNKREVIQNGITLCRPCAGKAHYHIVQ